MDDITGRPRQSEELGHQLEAVRSLVTRDPQDADQPPEGYYLDGERIGAAVALIVPIVEALVADGVTALWTREEQLVVEGLLAYRDRAPGGDSAPTCWFGVSTVDGQPWMFCMTRAFLLDVVALLERGLGLESRQAPGDSGLA